MRQGFYVNSAECIGCRACQVACKDKNALDTGILFRRVRTFEVGAYPTARIYHLAITCNHCDSPACAEACPVGSMHIDEADGTVQHDDSRCIGCGYCVEACPYGVPQFLEEERLATKCDACYQLRQNGEQPACVAACPMRALEFGPVDELCAAHPDAVQEVAVLPAPTQTHPNTLITPKPAALEPGFREIRI